MRNNTQRTKAYLATIVCHVLWGFSFMASRTGLNHVPVFQLLSHRFLMCLLILVGIWGVQKTAAKR